LREPSLPFLKDSFRLKTRLMQVFRVRRSVTFYRIIPPRTLEWAALLVTGMQVRPALLVREAQVI
jgi:hypothetical protein